MISRIWRRVFAYTAALLGLPVILSLGMRAMASPLGGFAEDDSWFYAQIAYQWPRVGFPSFDGVHPTSGFHLLWGGLLGIMSWLLSWVTADKHSYAVAFFSLYVILLAVVAEQSSRGARWRALSMCCVFFILCTGAFLMETALLTLFLLILGRQLLAFTETKARSYAGLHIAALGMAITLCRIDAFLIVFVWAAVGRRAVWSRPLTLGALLGVAVQFIGMQLLFDEWFSVSSLLKATRATHGEGNLFNGGLKLGIVFRAALGALLALWAWLAVGQMNGRKRAVQQGALLGVAVFTLGHLLLSEIRSWYFLPLYGLTWWLASLERGEEEGPSWRSSIGLSIAALAILIGGYKAYRMVANNAKSERAWAFQDRIQESVPKDQRIYEIDASGFPGFWSERSVINGDGLVNSYDYARRLSAGRLNGYLEEEQICWVIMTGRMAPKKASLLLDYHGLRVETSQATPVYPKALKRRAGTQLWKLKAPRCDSSKRASIVTIPARG